MRVKNKPDRNLVFLVLLCWFVATALVHGVLPLHSGGQMAAYLEDGRALVSGEQPYVGYANAEWPLTFYVGIFPALLEKMLSVPIIPIAKWLILALTIGSALTIHHLLNRCLKSKPMVASWVAMVVAAYSFVLIFNGGYGQIEHLFILVYLPWFLLRWSQWEGVPVSGVWRFGIAILAALGVSLNPAFILIALVPEIYWYSTRREGQPFRTGDFAVFGGIVLISNLSILLLPGEVREAFFGYILPLMIRRHTLSAISVEQSKIILQSLLVGGLAFLYRPQDNTGLSRLWRPLGLVILTAALVQFIPGITWHNNAVHINMVIWFLLIGAFFSRVGLDLTPVRGLVAQVTGANGVLILGVVGYIVLILWKPGVVVNEDWQAYILRYSTPDDRILIVDTAVEPGQPTYAQLNRAPGSRYSWAFPLVASYAGSQSDKNTALIYHPADSMPEMEIRYLHELAQDVQARLPKMVLVRDIPGCADCPENFVISEYLDQMGFFQDWVTDYAYVGYVEGYRVYQWQAPLPYEGDHYIFGGYYTLRAYQLSGTPVQACGVLTLQSWWQVNQLPEMDTYSMAFVMADANGQGVVSNDGGLVGKIASASFVDERRLDIPCDTPPGDYNLILTIYNAAANDEPVVVTTQDEQPIAPYLYLTTISVTP